jgi:HEAT repeat protein
MERAGAAYALCSQTPGEEHCLSTLLAELKGPHEDAAALAAWGLGKLPDPTDAALLALVDGLDRGGLRDQTRITAFRVFRARGLELHREIVSSLDKHWPRSEQVVRQALEDSRALVAAGAAEVLLRKGNSEEKHLAVARLQLLLRAAEPAARERAASALQLVEKATPEIADVLRATWKKERNDEVKKALLDALVKHAGPAGLEMFLDALRSHKAPVRRTGMNALRKSGVGRKELEAIEDSSLQVRVGVAYALAAFDTSAALPVFEKALKSGDDSVRRDALELIFDLKLGKPLLPLLIDSLAGSDTVQRGVVRPLVALGEEAVPQLLVALQSPSGKYGKSAAAVLSAIGAASLPGLRLAMKNKDVRVRYYAMLALSQMEGTTEDLKAALNDAYPIRRLAAAALAKNQQRAGCR